MTDGGIPQLPSASPVRPMPQTLAEWLATIGTLHPQAVALGLERVRAVYQRMQLTFTCPVITVAGTNGKGSTCAMLEAMLRAAGYRTGLYTSPHIQRYNERVRLDGREADDATLCAGFAAVEAARDGVLLTYFEFGTLAALAVCARHAPDAMVLEVGLGGRLDAVNLVAADVAVITTIGIDHVDYLGTTRASIGFEKAGIARRGHPMVIGEPDIPPSIVAHAAVVGAPLFRLGHEFTYADERAQWRYAGPGGARYGLPIPALRGAFQLGNAATALAALDLLRDRLPVAAGAIRTGLVSVEWPARMQVLPGRPTVVLDAAHNPHAAHALAAALGSMGYHAHSYAVFAALGDKDVEGIVRPLRAVFDRWFVASLTGPRTQPAAMLRERLVAAGVAVDAIETCPDVAAALSAARARAGEADRIVVFGSFLTLAAALDTPAAAAASAINQVRSPSPKPTAP